MITDPKILEYLDIISPLNSQILEGIRKRARDKYIPILKRDTENLLKFVFEMQNPKHILEVGTAVGYSAALMLENSNGDIVTIEKMSKRAAEAKRNFEIAGFCDRVKLFEGDAGNILFKLAGDNKKFDFIFMDAAKAQYITWLPMLKSLLDKNGILFSDNCLQEGDLTESSFAIRKRDKTIHKRMREYIYTLLHDKDLKSWIYPVGDGVLLSINRRQN